jgi:hypothetical protein
VFEEPVFTETDKPPEAAGFYIPELEDNLDQSLQKRYDASVGGYGRWRSCFWTTPLRGLVLDIGEWLI